ncbi:hypothetical protein AGRA3207_005421 [Actinomadura graeca]|uniref:Glycosyltransferase n=1 Tax=Actinomadura graeca TaxID=2750812 RepID=A0ABX8QZA8_9ACTN|nr:hypothetical protein [Actinomadura graeca]QXJ24156.1 hypothetical protein AGRA3207_005421 [Actinomadura graeca]
MIVCYAHGDGLGHLTRLRAVRHTLAWDDEVTVVTRSPHARDPRIAGGWRIAASLDGLAADDLVVDAFPAGLQGELRRLPDGVRVTHLARRLRWDAYRPLLPAAPPRFGRTYVLEPLEPAHEEYLRAVSDEVAPLRLADPPAEPLDVDGWLIVHGGPAAEILELVAYARDMAALEGVRPPMALVSPRRPDGLPADVAHLDAYPACPPGPRVERIVTAAGFNAVRQFAPWRDRHRMLPFPRSLDDQFARAAHAARTKGTPPSP